MALYAAVNYLPEVGGGYLEVDFKVKLFFGVAAIHIAEVLRYRVVKDQATERCVNDAGYLPAVDFPRHAHFYRRMQSQIAVFISHQSFVVVAEIVSLAGLTFFDDGQVIRAEHHVLCRHRNGATVHRLQQVVRRKHQEPGLGLSFG